MLERLSTTWGGRPADGTTVTGGSRAGADGAYVRFDTTDGDRTVEATTALSYVDADGAAGNLRAEGGRPFDEVREAARDAWEARLDDVGVTGGSDTLRRTFYSSLYRSFLAPNIGSDAHTQRHPTSHVSPSRSPTGTTHHQASAIPSNPSPLSNKTASPTALRSGFTRSSAA